MNLETIEAGETPKPGGEGTDYISPKRPSVLPLPLTPDSRLLVGQRTGDPLSKVRRSLDPF